MVSKINGAQNRKDSTLSSLNLTGKPFILYSIVDYIESHREILTLNSPLDSES